MMTREPIARMPEPRHQRGASAREKSPEANANDAFRSLSGALTMRPRTAFVILAGIVASQSAGGITPSAVASEKSIQLPPPEKAHGTQASSEILLEEEYEPAPDHVDAKRPATGAQKKAEQGEHAKAEHGSGDHAPAPAAGAGTNTEKHHAEETTRNAQEEAGDAHFGEALVEGNSGAKSVSSTAGLIWFGVVFVILVGFIYLLT